MPVNSKGRSNEAQRFPQGTTIDWQEQLRDVGENYDNAMLEIFQSLLQSSNQREQLVCIKKIGALLSSMLSSCHGGLETVLSVLVEVHSRCASRHPIQRAVASVLQSHAGSTEQLTVTKLVAKTIVQVLVPVIQQCSSGSAFNESGVLMGVQYVEVLMENFMCGEWALKMQLPLVLDFAITSIKSSCQLSKLKTIAMTTLIALLKATTNLMLKQAPEINLMLTTDTDSPICPGLQGSEERIHFSWPLELKDKGCQEKRVWSREKLASLLSTSEQLLKDSTFFPHDVTVSAAMLLVATSNLTLSLLPLTSATCGNSKESPPTLEKRPGGDQLVEKVRVYLTDLSPFAKLSLCHALLAKLPTPVITSLMINREPMLLALFPIICQLLQSFTESSERYIASRSLALWTSVARDHSLDIGRDSSLYNALLPSGLIMKSLLQFIWSLWEDPIDGIRYQCRDMFENIIKIYKHLQLSAPAAKDDFLSSLVDNLLSLDSPTRGQLILLATIADHVSISTILEASPHLPVHLLSVMGHQALACHAGDLWGRLVDLHWKTAVKDEEKESVWSQTWVVPLISAMCSDDQLVRKHVIQHCLPSLFHCTAKSLGFINKELNAVSATVSSSRKLTVQLACLHCAKTHSKESLVSSASLEELFTSAMHHGDEQVRLSALGMLCESNRTTELPHVPHLPRLLEFVDLNANSQSPGFRNPVLTLFKKLLIRIRDSSYALLKAHQRNTRSSDSSPDMTIAGFKDFLQTLLDQLFNELHPLSSFQRRNFSLSLLQLLAAIFDQTELEAQNTHVSSCKHERKSDKLVPSIPPIFEFSESVSEAQALSLVDGLRDPFDANRQLCLTLLFKSHRTKIGLNDIRYVRRCVKAFLQLVSSPKSVSCTSAASLLKLLMHFSCEEFNSCLSEELEQALPLNSDPRLSTLVLLCELLQQHITSAEQNLLQASVSSPMYGVLQSVRAVMGNLRLTPAPNACDVVNKLVKVCEKIALVVSPVVCSSSPEGFLPNTDEGQTAGVLESELSCLALRSGNAQSLLLCCWHSMKEIALLLGDIVGDFPVISEDDQSGMSSEQLEVMSRIFIHQLTEARHRGAFEMAYTGFCKLCHCLWTNSSPSLSKKPSLWIQDLLDSLQSTSLARLLTITRRSAGLPFYVQAILISEPSHNSFACCKSTMQTLLKVAREGVSADQVPPTLMSEDEVGTPVQSQPAAVHALNILRALYRESKLGDFVAPFIPEGVMVAVEGFSASLWPVRNSSTLLFSSLVSRIFGAKRVQDEHSIENKMTSREFFTRLPSLHGFLLSQLARGVDQLLGNGRELRQASPSLFPSLVILSRLYPSPLDEENSTVTMRPFVSLLVSCTGCPIWKTRVLVSRTLASVLTESTAVPLFRKLYALINVDNQNQVHGSLLVVHYVLMERMKLLEMVLPKYGSVSLAYWLLETHVSMSYLSSRCNPCVITNCLYVNILRCLLDIVCMKEPLFSSPEHQFQSKLKDIFTAASQTCFSGQPTFSEQNLPAVVGKEGMFNKNLPTAFFDLLLLAARHPRVLGFLTLSLNDVVIKSICNYSCLLVCIAGLKLINSMTPLEYLDLGRTITTGVSSRVLRMVTESETNSEFLAEAYIFLAEKYSLTEEECIERVLVSALQLCMRPTNRLDLTLSLIQFVSTCFPHVDTAILTKYLTKWIAHLEKVCSPTQPYEIRVQSARQLPALWSLVLKSVNDASNLNPSSSRKLLGLLSQLILTLLQDSDLDVRTQMSTAVVTILPVEAINEVSHPNASSALRWFIGSLASLVTNTTALFDVLLFILPQEFISFQSMHSLSQEHPPSQTACLLFDEDPINDYAEDLVILKLVVKAVRDKLDELPPHSLSATHLDQLVQALPGLLPDTDCTGDERCGFDVRSPWEDSVGFMRRTKSSLFIPLLQTVRRYIEN